MAQVEVVFNVDVETQKGHTVCLVGDDPALGAWDPLRGVCMQKNFSGQNWKRWVCSLHLAKNQVYQFRYYVCKDQRDLVPKQNGELNGFKQNHHVERPISVLKWETNVKPRTFSTEGVGETLELPVANFGKYDGVCHIGKGWLINQCEVQIRLHSNPIYMYKAKHREQSYSVKCVAMDYAKTQLASFEEDTDSMDGPPPCAASEVLVTNLSEDDCVPKEQGPAGMLYGENDYIVFRTQIPNPQNVGFQLDFFVFEPHRSPKFVGTSYLLPHKKIESQCVVKLPVIGTNHKPIGEVSLEMLLVTPLPILNLTMEQSFQTHWKWKQAKALDIGHRGMGASYSRVSMLKENTIASFAAAGKHGADFVEFDVLLSKDKKAVIYHDFVVNVAYTNKKSQKAKTELFEIPVKNLTLAQLQSMKLFVAGDNSVEINDEECPLEETEPFPTLEQCLLEVDANTGFNIEIKYPLVDINGVWEMENYLDVNETVNVILEDVFKCAGTRKIVFSSFDPDICILLQLKQNKYPVMLLHQGQTKVYVQYRDYRASTFSKGISFALSEHLLGVALHCEVLLQDLALIERVLDRNLVLFVWGDDNNNPHMIRRLRDLKIDGIICDRIDCHKPEHQ
ncbi:putative glycerophosphocholine phosphodiesterase GPCPD1 homolog 2, partial [Aplysia californica]|uniref:Glycerophosphocholine phosphodiesterase GPCPD1 homolog 2 n=1 Tax=Aplysia californica TaxID=6500 RepID=A0ABM1W1U4_APLCA